MLYYLNNTVQIRLKLFSFFSQYDIFKEKYLNFNKFGDFSLQRLKSLKILRIIYKCSGNKAVTNLNKYCFDLIFVLNTSNHK